MTSPGWPRLATRARRAAAQSLTGRWRTARRSGTFAFRGPDEWVVLDEAGELSEDLTVRGLWRPRFERGDYCTAAGPVQPVEHDGRAAWRVELLPPRHKTGRLEVVVDDQTGMVLREHNGIHLVEVLDLRVDEPVDDEVFRPQREAEARWAREERCHELARERPAPTPRWWPYRHQWSDGPALRVVDVDGGSGSVGRAPLGEQAPVSEWLHDPVVHRLEAGGWAWAVASDPPMTEAEAAEVVRHC